MTHRDKTGLFYSRTEPKNLAGLLPYPCEEPHHNLNVADHLAHSIGAGMRRKAAFWLSETCGKLNTHTGPSAVIFVLCTHNIYLTSHSTPKQEHKLDEASRNLLQVLPLYLSLGPKRSYTQGAQCTVRVCVSVSEIQ